MAVRRAVDGDAFHAQLLQERRHADAADRIDGVEHDLELRRTDSFQIDERVALDRIDVGLGEVFPLQLPDMVHVHEFEIARFGHVLKGLALVVGQEFPFIVEEFERIPLLRVVGGGQDDTAVGICEAHGHLRGWRRSQAGVDHVDSAGEQRAADQAVDHFAGNARVAAHDHFVAFPSREFHFKLAGVGRRELYDVDGGERVADGTADRAADAGNGFDQGHIRDFFTIFANSMSHAKL